MKVIFKVFLLASFLLIALFGFSSMGDGPAHCLASVMQGADCPAGLFGFASFHIGFFKNFSSAVFESLGLLAFFLILGILFAVAAVSGGGFIPKDFSFRKLNDETAGPFLLIKKLRNWLSLLETSPTFAIAR